MKWLDALKIIGPAILAVVPGAAPFTPLIIAGMELAEKSGKKGADKKVIAKEAVELGARTANTIANREVINPDEAVRVADGTIDIIVTATKSAEKLSEK